MDNTPKPQANTLDEILFELTDLSCWDIIGLSQEQVNDLSEQLEVDRAKAKQQIEALITEARIDEVQRFTDVDTIPGIPVPSCSTCEDIYDNSRDRLTQLKENK